MGAPAFVDAEDDEQPAEIAEREMAENKLPLTVKK
jgi:DNA-directed RNA polymerase subunit K/omega